MIDQTRLRTDVPAEILTALGGAAPTEEQWDAISVPLEPVRARRGRRRRARRA